MSAKTNTDAVRSILDDVAEAAHEEARERFDGDNFAMIKFKQGVQWSLEQIAKNLAYIDSLWDLFAEAEECEDDQINDNEEEEA